ncbi:hypothetical protein [Streptomyces luteocolor]|uniref:hypothetical protein n=1 Tax=Streptomyces luteocolor TaxID=285500 RepID=UPI000853058D|nr:hypothetical protein [Streptomyces luteocolor]
MSRYLEEAAALLRKSAESNEKQNNAKDYRIDSLMEGRERIARQFATLAAIDKGLLPADITADVVRALTERAEA